MQRVHQSFKLSAQADFKNQLLSWAQNFNTVIWLDSNEYHQKYSEHNCVLAVGNFTELKCNFQNAFEQLKEFQKETNDYIFGYLGYDLKNDVENLSSSNYDGLHFPDLYFFQPKKLIFINDYTVEFLYLPQFENEIITDFESIQQIIVESQKSKVESRNDIKIKLRIHKDEYHQKVNKVLEHIHRGDIYEANFCQEFYAENTLINPVEVYQNLNNISKPPFASFLKLENKYLLSASPERYIKKKGTKVISQPIKGTAKRSQITSEDEILKQQLKNDEKERAENIMIVDLVRNDLSHTAVKGSVKVEELCKVYTFEQVHQMISTVVSIVDKNTNPIDIIKDTFPMGSMTGAPKISAMKIIEKLEETKRGLYSGAVGYMTPEGDFDFNVVIRSILYNESQKYVSYSVGGAITSKSTPENEYEECLLKAKAMKEVLINSI